MNEYVSELLNVAIDGEEINVLTKDKYASINAIDLLNKEKIEWLRRKNLHHAFV